MSGDDPRTDLFLAPPLGPERPSQRRYRKRFRHVPLRIVLPNLVTLLALCLGLTAIRFAVEGSFEKAVFAILAAAVFDGVDGRLARALKGTTRFGAELDSLADFVDFGVAPGLTLYFWNLHEVKINVWFDSIILDIACALRLARFNVGIDDPLKPAWASRFFTGMPAPAGAVVALLPLYLQLSSLEIVPLGRGAATIEIAFVLVVAALMASPLPHFSGKSIGRVPREYVILVLFVVAVLVLLLATFPMEMMAALTIGYAASIPFAVRAHRGYVRRDTEAATREPGRT